jgi:hypothetical protein
MVFITFAYPRIFYIRITQITFASCIQYECKTFPYSYANVESYHANVKLGIDNTNAPCYNIDVADGYRKLLESKGFTNVENAISHSCCNRQSLCNGSFG